MALRVLPDWDLGPFVVEADEYDSAFFDKRSKFVHYRPKTVVINNLEFDHADIFDDLAAIQTQFHHLIRCVPSSGKIVAGEGEAIDGVLRRGVWTPVERMGSSDTNTWSVDALTESYSQLSIQAPDGECCEFAWSLIGRHNAENALSAIAAAFDVGVPVHVSCEALSQFQGVKRRLELLGEPAGVSVYDDFAHHPTAIASTLLGVRSLVEEGASHCCRRVTFEYDERWYPSLSTDSGYGVCQYRILVSARGCSVVAKGQHSERSKTSCF